MEIYITNVVKSMRNEDLISCPNCLQKFSSLELEQFNYCIDYAYFLNYINSLEEEKLYLRIADKC